MRSKRREGKVLRPLLGKGRHAVEGNLGVGAGTLAIVVIGRQQRVFARTNGTMCRPIAVTTAQPRSMRLASHAIIRMRAMYDLLRSTRQRQQQTQEGNVH